MARDYKGKRKGGSGASGLIGVTCGLVLGLAVAGFVYFKDRRTEAPVAQAAKVQKKKARGGDGADAEGAESGAPEEAPNSYDFYKMLPKFEVVVPEKDKDVRPDIRGVPETRRGTYVLQAGSYKNFADADHRPGHVRQGREITGRAHRSLCRNDGGQASFQEGLEHGGRGRRHA